MATQDAPFAGGRIPPCWQIQPAGTAPAGPGHPILLGPGAGFGTGGHPTTRLCLQAIAALAPRDRSDWRMLDFGSGSGILSIAAARLGARVTAVEIDPVAIASARENAALNGLAERITVQPELPAGRFDLVVANILRPVLLAFAPRLAAAGTPLVLSGLVATDLPELSVGFAPLLGAGAPERYRDGDWCALVWR